MTSVASATFMVTVDGQRLPRPDRLRSARVSSRLGQPTQCELVIGLGHGEHAWPAEWRFGTPLTVQVTGDSSPLFDGEVTGVELARRPDGLSELRVRAYDVLHRLRKRQRLRVFEDLTVAELAARLTSDLPLELRAGEDGPRLDRLVQHRQSDFELLAEVTAQAGLHPVLRGRTLRLLTAAGDGEPVELRPGTSVWDLRIEANLDRVVRRVTAFGWHTQRAEVMARPAATPRGPRPALDPDPREVGVDGERFLVDQAVRGDEQLAAIAQANLDAATNRAVTVSGVADGDARLWAGQRVTLAGVPAEVAGGYVLGTVVHTVDGDGYQTAFSTEQPAAAAPAPESGGTALTIGHVSAVDDPAGLGRVRVTLRAHGDLDIGWLAVLCPGAGQGRGLVVLPDVGDTVVVALPRHRPADGIVLGSLYGTVAPPDPGVDGGAVRRWSMRTAAGQSVVVDDTRGLVQVQNQGGSYLELGPDRLRLHATTDLVIDAPGKKITVRASTVDFEQALV